MTIQNLSDRPFDEILTCFLAAFENYYVQMPADRDYYKNRWKTAKVNFRLSYGMFDKGKLVGFILHAVDQRSGIQVAYNTGTGVIPRYRGKRIVEQLYAYAWSELKEHHIEKVTLEVITKNERAIRSYKAVGFEISRTYTCYNGPINIERREDMDYEELALKSIDWNGLPNQEFYSWDNEKECVLEGKYKYFQVMHELMPEAFFIIDPDLHYLAQFDVFNTNVNSWSRLFSVISEISNPIKINNVDRRLKNKLDFLNTIALNQIVDQYEMELTISD